MSDRLRFVGESPREIAEALVFMLGWNRSAGVPVFVDRRPAPAFTVQSGGDLWRRAAKLDLEESAEVAVGLPLSNGQVGESTVLWAWLRTPDSLRRAERFSPEPSMVLRFGASSERLLLWSLGEPIGWPSITPHVERLAYALRAPRNRSEPEKLRIPVPGTFLRRGRSRPAPVLVTRLTAASFVLSEVTGRLKDAPSKDAWKERGRAA